MKKAIDWKSCVFCDELFMPRNETQRFCSRQCVSSMLGLRGTLHQRPHQRAPFSYRFCDMPTRFDSLVVERAVEHFDADVIQIDYDDYEVCQDVANLLPAWSMAGGG